MVKICKEEYPKDTKYNKYFEEYPYELSDFQKYAIESIVEEKNCLVTAHTGSGKTLPAEFAIKYLTDKGKKVIYTSPIKALSNQKFYDFNKKFPEISVGLFTGDIKTNPEADVLIMTTEILMNYLFNMKENESIVSNLDFNVDIMNELGCVVFDEVHYINDLHRGEVWEKTILMLPDHIQMVMLSATIESPIKFAEWCEKGGEGKEVYLCSTDHRVVPLGHYSYITSVELFYKKLKDKDLEAKLKKTTNKLIEIQTPTGNFKEENIDKIKNVLDLMKKKDIYMKRQNVLNNLCKHLKDNNMLPGIAFIFSRKQVEKTAGEITINLLDDDSNIPSIVKHECDMIIRKLPNSADYLELDEYKNLIKLLEKGIGIHHSGMIPVLREIVELMISKKYIKLLLATESFAIGLDCPIKTAIFPALKKFDGNGLRELYSHEYTQMAGRAGRRGIDKVGYVVHCNNLFEMPFKSTYKRILSGTPQKLTSKYNISFSVILNLIKNGKSNELVKFSEKTMMNVLIKNLIKSDEAGIVDIENKILNMNKQKEFLSIPQEDILEYININSDQERMKGNKRKNALRAMNNIKDKYKNFEKELSVFINIENSKEELNNIQMNKDGLNNQIERATMKLCELLVNENYIKKNNDDLYELTNNGTIASMIAEINNIVFTKIITKTDIFKDYNENDIISSLSCLIDIKTSEEETTSIPNSENKKIKYLTEMIKKYLKDYSIIELNYDINTGLDYEKVNYEIPNIIEGWLNCDNEAECRIYIKEIINEKYQIMTGEFIKCLLKLTAMVKEIRKMCEELGYIELLNKIEMIDKKILKYVVTPQSLYL